MRIEKRGSGSETEKVIKEIMDGSLRELQRTNSHFQFAAGWKEGDAAEGSKPSHSNGRLKILAVRASGSAYSRLLKNSTREKEKEREFSLDGCAPFSVERKVRDLCSKGKAKSLPRQRDETRVVLINT